jgi:hypothetical protein
LLKSASKRKRTRAEMEEIKLEQEELKADKFGFLKAKRLLADNLQEKEQKVEELKQYEQIVHDLFDQGVLDHQGHLINKQHHGDEAMSELEDH